RMRELQARWKQVALAPRAQGEAMWRRFKTAQDEVFNRTAAHVAAQNEERTQNLARKQSLCEQAEALADSSDWVKTATEIKQLQAEWKTIGPVRKSKSDAVWQRFRTACDRFFDRYKHRDQIALQEKAGARESVIRELESIVNQGASGDAPAPEDLHKIVQDARARWSQAPELPRTVQQELAARYYESLGRIVALWPAAFAGTDLDPEATRKRMEKLV